MLLDKSIADLAAGLRSKKFSSYDLVSESLKQIEKNDPKINSQITAVKSLEVLSEAKERDNIKISNDNSPLCGLPFVLKDSYITQSIRTTAGSRILDKYFPQYDSSVYSRLKNSGSILIGKSGMDAWGHGATNENSDYGPVLNPYDTSRVAGGSGGGPAAAVASRMATFGIGEDTGGSIRNPAAWCGVCAMKVSYGRVSRYGCIAYASSFDTVGPTAKTVEDCALVLEAIAGQDALDATSSRNKVPEYSQSLNKSVEGMKIGWPEDLFTNGLDSQIGSALEAAGKEFEKLGATLVKASIPLIAKGISLYYIIAPSETSSNLARYDGIRFGEGRDQFGDEAKRRIMTGTYALSAGYYDAYYKKALKVRTLLIAEYEKAFSSCDAILMPVTPFFAPKIGELMDDPMQNMLADTFTVTQNPAGVPSLALPAGFGGNGLPIGMQLVGKMFSEEALFRLGHQYQLVTDWHNRKPSIVASNE